MPYKFTGDGTQFIPGVPARDLTDEDVAALAGHQRADLEANAQSEVGIYKSEAADTAPEADTAPDPEPDDPSEGDANLTGRIERTPSK